MGMVVRTNMAGLNANNALNMASKTQQNAMQKLASGFRINKAADDASGLAISEKMKNQIKALDTAADNCEDGANMIQTAEGYMNETHDILNRMVELSEKAANGVLAKEDRDALQDEMNELCAEIDRMATTANFNGKKLMDGSIGSNGIVTLKSDIANGNSYEVSTTAAPSTTEYTATAIAAGDMKDTALEELSGSKLQKVLSDISSAVESYAKSKNAAAGGSYGVLVNKDGEIHVFDTVAAAEASTFYKTNAYAKKGEAIPNTSGYSSFEVDFAVKTDNDPVKNDGIKLQIGESSVTADKLDVEIGSFHTDTLLGGVNNFVNLTANGTDKVAQAQAKTTDNDNVSTYTKAITVDITEQEAASAAADALRLVSNYVSDQRGQLGAQQNRLEHTVNNLTTASENITASNSRIRDTNMAEEMMSYTSKNVVAQAAQAMLAQANSQPQNVLSLLQ